MSLNFLIFLLSDRLSLAGILFRVLRTKSRNSGVTYSPSSEMSVGKVSEAFSSAFASFFSISLAVTGVVWSAAIASSNAV